MSLGLLSSDADYLAALAGNLCIADDVVTEESPELETPLDNCNQDIDLGATGVTYAGEVPATVAQIMKKNVSDDTEVPVTVAAILQSNDICSETVPTVLQTSTIPVLGQTSNSKDINTVKVINGNIPISAYSLGKIQYIPSLVLNKNNQQQIILQPTYMPVPVNIKDTEGEKLYYVSVKVEDDGQTTENANFLDPNKVLQKEINLEEPQRTSTPSFNDVPNLDATIIAGNIDQLSKFLDNGKNSGICNDNTTGDALHDSDIVPLTPDKIKSSQRKSATENGFTISAFKPVEPTVNNISLMLPTTSTVMSSVMTSPTTPPDPSPLNNEPIKPLPVRPKEMKLPDTRNTCVPVKASQMETVSVSPTPVMASSKINVDSEGKSNVTMQASKTTPEQVTSVTDDVKIHNSTFCKKWVSVCPDPNDVSKLDHVIRSPLPSDISGETSHGMKDITSISCQIENMKKIEE